MQASTLEQAADSQSRPWDVRHAYKGKEAHLSVLRENMYSPLERCSSAEAPGGAVKLRAAPHNLIGEKYHLRVAHACLCSHVPQASSASKCPDPTQHTYVRPYPEHA